MLISLTTTTGPNITAELVGATISITPFGLFITAPPTDTRICIVNGIQTVVQGKCPQSAGRRLAHAGGGNEGGLVGKVPANGGGLAIYGTATLTNTNVYANQAQGQVCSPSTFPGPYFPALRWFVTCTWLRFGRVAGSQFMAWPILKVATSTRTQPELREQFRCAVGCIEPFPTRIVPRVRLGCGCAC